MLAKRPGELNMKGSPLSGQQIRVDRFSQAGHGETSNPQSRESWVRR